MTDVSEKFTMSSKLGRPMLQCNFGNCHWDYPFLQQTPVANILQEMSSHAYTNHGVPMTSTEVPDEQFDKLQRWGDEAAQMPEPDSYPNKPGGLDFKVTPEGWPDEFLTDRLMSPQEAQFGTIEGCLCKPYTLGERPVRLLTRSTDTVNMIDGYARHRDCPTHGRRA